MSRLGADALLLTAAVVWGVTFVVQKDIGDLPPLAFVAARFAISALAVAPLAYIEGRRAGLAAGPGARRLAGAIGILLFLGASLQQAGLATTSATNGGFLTASYVVLTPFVVWALSRARPRAIVFAAGARVARRRVAPGYRRGASSAADCRRWARPHGRPGLGDRNRADLALSRPRRPAADARLFPSLRSAARSPLLFPRYSRRLRRAPSSRRRRQSCSPGSSPAPSGIRCRSSRSAIRRRPRRP